MNRIEEIKKEKDGLDVLGDIPRYAAKGWESITEGDRERLKWAGVFFRKQTPGHFMMRVRIPNGMSNAAQFRAIAAIGQEFGKGFVDITTRQQIQLRWFSIDQVPFIWRRLEEVGLGSLQTGMDNIRNVIGCPVAGLSPNELLDASPVVKEFTNLFVGNREFTNLPRKFNVAITGCPENCVHAVSQDIGLTPAIKKANGVTLRGFNVAIGGKQGSGGFRPATPLDVFARPSEAAELCGNIARIFRDYGLREARNKARLAFLVDDWGAERFRAELERQMGRPLFTAGADRAEAECSGHIGVFPQRQPGLSYVGMVAPVGRVTAEQLNEAARLAESYGNDEIRLTTEQNVIIPNVPDALLGSLLAEPLMQVLSPNPSGVMRGLVSCTGIDYCHFALIETKDLAVRLARHLEAHPGLAVAPRIHWSGCANACGNHIMADIGLQGKRARVNGQVVDAVDVFLGKQFGRDAEHGATRWRENVPCAELPALLESLLRQPALAQTKEAA